MPVSKKRSKKSSSLSLSMTGRGTRHVAGNIEPKAGGNRAQRRAYDKLVAKLGYLPDEGKL